MATNDRTPQNDSLRRGSATLAPAVRVTLDRAESPPTTDELLWKVIRNRTEAITFEHYKSFVDAVVIEGRMFRGVDAYLGLKAATRAWLQTEAGVWIGHGEDPLRLGQAFEMGSNGHADGAEEAAAVEDAKDVQALRKHYLKELDGELGVLPYHKLIVDSLGVLPLKPPEVVLGEYGISPARVYRPYLLELFWSYWHEEGMLVQTMNAISRRFQNRRGAAGGPDPLARMELDPLRTVNNIVWGYVQDEWNLLTVQRRAYEYQHEYGISLLGKAIPGFEPADSRPRFLTAFHDLLAMCATFYEADDDTTVRADAFGVLNALKDVHPVLSEGAHNQFGDMTWTAREEMLVKQWILSRPEFHDFLGGRTMVAVKEPWMRAVDAMKQVQGWGDSSVTHFRDLAVIGEQLLLSIRYGNWSVVNDSASAQNWARFWREEVKSYMHSYRVVTGVDLTGQARERVDVSRDGRYLQPAVHLRKRLEERNRRQPSLPAGSDLARGSGLPATSARKLGA